MANSRLIFFSLFFLFNFYLRAQTTPGSINEIAVKLIKTLRSDMDESIFIHTDKSVYKAGETIWFNAYLINKISRNLSHYSKLVFVDLVNDKDSLVSQLILDPSTLRLDGGIQLPVELRDGTYWLRGYTPYILQNDSSDICVHPIYVVNSQNISPGKPIVEANVPPNPLPKLEIYPEGGSLVAGVTSVVAFHVTDQNNNPLTVEGYLKDNHDTITTRFKTSMPGYGKFSFFPWKIRQYRVIIRTQEGREFSYPLPPTDNYAATISVAGETRSAVKVLVSLGDSLYDKKTVTYLLGVSRDSLCYAGVGEGMYETEIPTKNFPQGEATLLLFDGQKKLLSERNIYIDKEPVSVNITADKDAYPARQNVTLNISVNDEDSQPVLSLISVSVTDNSFVRYYDDDDINSITEKSLPAEARDLMMVAQKNKYRKWNFADSTGRINANEASNEFFGVRGTATTKNDKPLQGVVITIISTRQESIFKTDTTDSRGHFNLNLPAHYDSTEFMLQASDKKGNSIDARIVLDSVALPRFATPMYLKRTIPVADTVEIREKRSEKTDFLLPGRGKELKEVIVRTKIKKPLNFDETQRVSRFSKILTPDMMKTGGAGSLVNSLLFIPGVQLRNGRLVLAGNDDEPLLVLDGAEIDSYALKVMAEPGLSPVMSFLNSISPSTIGFVEVLNGGDAAIYGMKGGNGVIVIHTTTTTGNYGGSGLIDKTGLINFHRAGFSTPTTFSEPDYSKKDVRKSNASDQRSTIYWSGPVITDNNGKAILNFYTADPVTTYTVTVKGITAWGDIFLKRFILNRK